MSIPEAKHSGTFVSETEFLETPEEAIVTLDVYEDYSTSIEYKVKNATSIEELVTLWNEYNEDYEESYLEKTFEIFCKGSKGKIHTVKDIEIARPFINWEDETIPIDVLKAYFVNIRDRNFCVDSRELKRFKNDEEFFKLLGFCEANDFFTFFPDGISDSMREWIAKNEKRLLAWTKYSAYLESLVPGKNLRMFSWDTGDSGWSFSRYFIARDYASAKKLLLASEKTNRFNPQYVVDTIPMISEIYEGFGFDVYGGEYW